MEIEKKRTVVIGASPNENRYSYKATCRLQEFEHPVIPVGLRKGDIRGINIETEKINIEDVDTVTLYVGPKNQKSWYDYILSLKPKRLIFNPGTENPELFKKAKSMGIEALNACTLVMVSIGNY